MNPIILTVEDEATAQNILKQLLESFDYETHIVSSGEEALKALSMTKYSAVLMDISLPGMDGYDCTAQIRELDAKNSMHTPIIALTENGEIENVQQCLRSGMDDYMSKPFNPEDLRKMLLRWVYSAEYPNLKVLPTSSANTKTITVDESKA